jgi:hypothetical protein
LIERVSELCSRGRMDEQDDEFRVMLDNLGFYNGQE